MDTLIKSGPRWQDFLIFQPNLFSTWCLIICNYVCTIHVFQCILKAKSNLTLWTTEYIFTVFDFNQIKYCIELLVPTLT